MYPLHHIGYWVDDLDAAMKQWSRDLDVGPFDVIEHIAFEEFVLTAAARPATTSCSTTRPPSPPGGRSWSSLARSTRSTTVSPPRTAITPGAISHVSWVVPDVGQESARLERLGCQLINTARSGPISVAWHDGGPLFPHPVELHQHNDVIAGMHARLAALRDGSQS